MSPRKARWWGLGIALFLDAILATYLVMRLHSSLEQAARGSHPYLIVATLILVGTSIATLAPLVIPKWLLPPRDLALPIAISIAILWPILGIPISAVLGL